MLTVQHSEQVPYTRGCKHKKNDQQEGRRSFSSLLRCCERSRRLRMIDHACIPTAIHFIRKRFFALTAESSRRLEDDEPPKPEASPVLAANKYRHFASFAPRILHHSGWIIIYGSVRGELNNTLMCRKCLQVPDRRQPLGCVVLFNSVPVNSRANRCDRQMQRTQHARHVEMKKQAQKIVSNHLCVAKIRRSSLFVESSTSTVTTLSFNGDVKFERIPGILTCTGMISTCNGDASDKKDRSLQ